MTYCAHTSAMTATIGYSDAGDCVTATLTTAATFDPQVLPFNEAFWLASAGPGVWEALGRAGGHRVYPGWVRGPGRAVDYGCWLTGLDVETADALRRLTGQVLLVRWNAAAVTLWGQGIDDGPALDLGWFTSTPSGPSHPTYGDRPTRTGAWA